MIAWLKRLWTRMKVVATDDSAIFVFDTTDDVVRLTVAVAAGLLGVVIHYAPVLDPKVSGPLADQLFRVATQLWSVRWTA